MLQRQTAIIIGVSEATIYNWERGVEPELRHMPAIIKFLGFNPLPSPRPDEPLEQLRHYKRSMGMDFIRLGEVMGRDPEQLSDWLSGRHQPIRKNFENIKQFLKNQKYFLPIEKC